MIPQCVAKLSMNESTGRYDMVTDYDDYDLESTMEVLSRPQAHGPWTILLKEKTILRACTAILDAGGIVCRENVRAILFPNRVPHQEELSRIMQGYYRLKLTSEMSRNQEIAIFRGGPRARRIREPKGPALVAQFLSLDKCLA